jgi:CheY-like chemotaxis protein/two-component sensor histidine kinase
LGRDSGLTAQQSESLGVIHRSGEHLLGLINDVLSISKIEAGKLVLTEQVFDPRKTLRSVEEMLRMRADAKNLTLLFEVEPNIPKLVKGDENKLRQVLVNLLGNAVKFTESGGVVLRCAWSDEGKARFEVEDTGFGIAEDEIGHLFEAFVQTESGRRAKEGTGLGLVISRQIVELMGGEIKVKSRLNEGTVFSFEANLPLAAESEKPAEKCKVAGLAADEHSRRVLVVDDTPENRMLLTRLLSSIGFEVREAANGEEAFDAWVKWQPHLIFMDLRMPVLDGYEATRKIRAEEERRNGDDSSTENFRTKIVALTASAFESERGAAIQEGADDFLAKPFRHETIFENLTKHLGVRFRYENEDDSEAPTEIVSNADFANLTPERFAVMKPELFAQFEHALRAGDDLAALRATDELRNIDPALAATIQHAVKDFDFDLVLRAMGKD